MRSYSKRVMTAILAVIMLLSVIAPIYASAAEVTMDLSKAIVSRDHTLNDSEGNIFSAAYGLKEEDNPFGYEIRPRVKKMCDYTAKSPDAPENDDDWVYGQDYVYCFCIEHGVPLPDSNNYSGSTSETHGNKYELLSAAQKDLLSLALAYGYPNRTGLKTSKDANACYSATQLIVWQITLGFRTSPTELNDKTYPMDGYSGTMTEQFTSNKYLKEFYDAILSDMATHYTRPSFTSNVPAAAKTYEMDYVNGKYTVTLTDTNNVLSKYTVTTNGGASVSVSGNKLTISSTKPLTDAITIKLNRQMPRTNHTTGFLIWSVKGSEGDNQDMVSGVPADNDPVPAYLKVNTASGSVKIVKTSEDGVVDGIKFKITGNGVDQTVTTANGGVFQIQNLRPGTYTVTELAEDKYEEQAPQTVTVTSGQTATVTFSNILKRGELKIIKTSEDGKVADVPFTVTGNGVNQSVRTDKNGEIKLTGLLPGKYTVTEQSESWYEPQKSQTVTVTYGQTAEVTFRNILKRGDLVVTKTAEDGLEEGVRFRLTGTSNSGAKIDVTATVDSTGKAYFKDILVGSGYVLEEVDTAIRYEVPDNQEVEIRWAEVTAKNVENVLKRGSLKVIKTSEDDFVEGVKFHLFGTSLSGEKVDVYATTDSNGIAVFEDILIGDNYTLEEVDTAERYIIPDSQTTEIQWNKVTQKDFHNTLKRGNLKVIKTSEDDFVEGVKFHLFGTSLSGEKVDVYATTNKDGIALFENIFIGDNYTLEEVDTAERYIIPDSQTTEIQWNEVTQKNFHNTLKRGSLKVIKTSEDDFVEGVKFHLFGTSLSGEKVDVYATTDKDGIALFENILIGDNYTLEEVDTAERYIIPDSQTTEIQWNKVTQKDFHNTLKRGSLKVIKTSEDNFVEGVKFHLYGTALSGEKVDVYATTDSNGIAVFEDILIGDNYTLEEVDTAERYLIPDSQTTEIQWNKVTQKDFRNTLKRGDLKVIKTSEDDFVEGVKFHLFGTSLSGEKVDVYATTDKSGIAVFEDILIGENYTIEEVDTATRYVVPEDQTGAIRWNEVTEIPFRNVLKKWRADAQKLDKETDAQPQGDATLEGAVYGVYKDGVLVDTYTTDKNGAFVTDYYPCYEDVEWTIREISPSEGYLLDPTVYHPDTDAGLYTVERNTAILSVYEDVIKGKVSIIKHTDDGSTKIETPEAGAEFEVYLKSAGSYDAADASERDILVCDEFGFAMTKDLPFGTYVVKQTKGWAGRELMPAFEVFVSEDGEEYRYLINNANFHSYLHVVKADATTGKTIPYAGAGFQIYAPDGTLVTMTYTYPALTVIDTFYTDENGTLITPEKLPYGEGYSLVEVQAPHGYVLDSTPIYFDVTNENSAIENGITIVKVVKENEPQKGSISVSKSGEVFSSVVEHEGIYQPVYEIQGLAGAVYEIRAAEDVITSEGTLRYSKDEVVATITTGEDGTAASEPLFLGKYTIQEITAPNGMVINGDIVTVELTYAGQEIQITTTSAAFVNERQKAEISFEKVMEQDEKYEIGLGDEILSVQFGLFAMEDIIAANGTMIPKDGLIETAFCDENGKAAFATDLPVGAKVYVKELAADDHYLVSDSIHPVIFEYAGQEVALVEIPINEGKPIHNEIIRGSIIGKKLDEDGFTICGAVFGLFRENETVFTEETALAVATSNEIGVFGFEDVPYGRWIVREIKAAPAFVLNENSYAVTVGEDEEIIEIIIENDFITGSVTTTKVDAEYPDNKLTGAVFEIYVDVDGNGEFDAQIDKLVGEMTETDAGVYVMNDLRYNGYFLYEKVAPEGFLKDEGYHYFEIRNDGETVTVENEAGVGFINQPSTGELELTKKDVSTGKLLANVGFRIRNEVGEVVAEGYTDENGIAKFTLRQGKYTYQEFAPLEGYILDATEYPFEIKENGEIVKAEMTNEPVTDIPQTGDDSNLGFWIGLAAIALGGLIATVIIVIKQKKDDE